MEIGSNLGVILLIVGTLIPWVTGTLCLLALFRLRQMNDGNLLAVGAGFFLGYLTLSFILLAQDSLTGSVSFWPASILLSLISLAAYLWLKKQPSRTPANTGNSLTPPFQTSNTWVIVLLVAAIIAHWGFSALEIVSQPLFPWDGLAVWAYRAKAWYLDSAISPVLTHSAWLATADQSAYTTAASGYPKLPSLAHLWAALSLGRWSESLINLPVLFCGTAITLGLAGALRSTGTSLAGQLTGAYLLLSVPLFGAHMSLGGYGDIWMAGYAGMGMTVLLAGLVNGQKVFQALGIGLLFASLFVKPEGTLWLLVGSLLLSIHYMSARMLIGALVAAPAIVLIALLTGYSSVTLPGLGEMGYQDGALLVGTKGSIELAFQSVRGAYLQNAFVLGSWHLVWIVILIVSTMLPFADKRLRKTGLTFVALFLCSQGLVFGLTSQGEFARSYTAINRLPLQMLPALIFLAVLAARPMTEAARTLLAKHHQRIRSVFAVLITLILVSAGVVAWTVRDIGQSPQSAFSVAPDNLAFVIGGGSLVDGRLEINQFQDGIAVLSSGEIKIRAKDVPFLDPDLVFAGNFSNLDQAPAFFWRRANQQREVSRATLTKPGLVKLSDYEDWHGAIVEVGFFFVEGNSEKISLGNGTLSSESVPVALRSIPGQWFAFSGWTQRSLNFISGGGGKQRLTLLQLVILLALLGTLLIWLLTGRESILASMAIMLAFGWVVLDARWLAERSWQARLSARQTLNMTMEERLQAGDDGKFYDYLSSLKQNDMDLPKGRTLILLDPAEFDQQGLRAKYHLLPHPSHMTRRMPAKSVMSRMDYLLFLGKFTDGDPRGYLSESGNQTFERLGVESNMRGRLELISSSEKGTLFRVKAE